MLIGLTIYLSGRKWLPPDSPIVEKSESAPKPRLTHRERMAVVALLLLLPVLTMAIIGNQQIFNAYLVWAERNANLIFFGKKMPTTRLITLDSIVSVSFLAGSVVFWRLWSKKFPEPPEITKIGIGSLVAVTGFISLAGGLLEKMPATHFWLLHSALCGTAGIIFLQAGHFFGYLLAPSNDASRTTNH